MLSKLILFLCLPAILLMGEAQYSVGDIPEWVRPYECPLEDVAVKPSQVNVQHLLDDCQINQVEKTRYYHEAIKALTKSGVEDVSQLSIDFDPAYYQVTVHAIRVLRDGKWSDRLESAKHKVLQRETELEHNLYDGDLTLVYFLNDIQEGDVVEYAYSITGEHPLHASHYTNTFFFQWRPSVERVVCRLLAPPSFSFATKMVNTAIEPQVTDLSPSVREWLWEAVETPAYLYEPGQPIWHNPPAQVQISQFADWGEVVQKEYRLYRLSQDFFDSVPAEMQALVEEWKLAADDDKARALLALRFVQDKIRYLGIEEGTGGFEPRPPHLTFQRRFGDCKDKTLLLHGLLALMDIDSTPVLVHATRGKRLAEVLPTSRLFNHVVLRIEVNGMFYFVDPTMSLQGGDLENNCFPSYEWGLVLDPNDKGLIPLPKLTAKKPVELKTSIILDTPGTARLKIKCVFYDFKADQLRRQVAQQGLKTITELSLAEMQTIYGAVSLDGPIEILDDRENNIYTSIESYRVPMQTVGDKKVLEIFSYVLSHHLYKDVSPLRLSPCEITYPRWTKESIHIEDPFLQWKSFDDEYSQEHESLLYKLSTHIDGHDAHFDIELKHLQDHIPQASLQNYWNIVKDINWKALPRMTVVEAQGSENVAHDDN